MLWVFLSAVLSPTECTTTCFLGLPLYYQKQLIPCNYIQTHAEDTKPRTIYKQIHINKNNYS